MSTMFHSRGLTNRTRLLGAVSIVVGAALVATVSVVPVAAAGCISTSDCLSKMTLAEKAGQMTNNPNLEAEGTDEKVGGKIQNKVGQIKKVFEK